MLLHLIYIFLHIFDRKYCLLNYNKDNPITNTRAASDNPDTILLAVGGYGRGMRSEGNLAITLKHFPGDERDDRNQHFCTTVNDMTNYLTW